MRKVATEDLTATLAVLNPDDKEETTAIRNDRADDLGILGELERLRRQALPALRNAKSFNDTVIAPVQNRLPLGEFVAVDDNALPYAVHKRHENHPIHMHKGARLLDALEGTDELLIHRELHPLVEANDTPEIVIAIGHVEVVEGDNNLLVAVVLVHGPEEIDIVTRLHKHPLRNAAKRLTGVGHHHRDVVRHRLASVDVAHRVMDVIEVLEVGVVRNQLATNDTEQIHGHLQGIDTPTTADVAPETLNESKASGDIGWKNLLEKKRNEKI